MLTQFFLFLSLIKVLLNNISNEALQNIVWPIFVSRNTHAISAFIDFLKY